MGTDIMEFGMVALLGSLLSEGEIAKLGSDPRADQGAVALLLVLARAGYLEISPETADIRLTTARLRNMLISPSQKLA